MGFIKIRKLVFRNQREKWLTNFLIIGTFSEKGPKKCSGLEIKQYTELELENQFSNCFSQSKCTKEDHITPFKTVQNFNFCAFKKIK